MILLRRTAFALLAAAALAPAARAGLLSAGSVSVLDANGAPRSTFANNERITFQQRVFNAVASPSRVTFTFVVLSPAGSPVFRLAGNAVPGSVGNAATQLGGLPISKFYAGPGIYTLQALAALDAQTVTQQTTFVVSSPNILLLYPPNGATGIADVPLTFRWVSSGGSSYKVTVGDNPSFYNSLFTQATAGETSLSYPVNPSDPRQRLSSGQMYYWKVEAFDASGQLIGSSAVPFSFSVETSALSRDMAVTDLAVDGGPDVSGNIPFKVTVKNQGGTAQANIPLRFSVGGLAASGSPVSMNLLGPGEARDYAFAAPMPPGSEPGLAIACLEFSDDNLTNNCRTLAIERPTVTSTGPVTFGGAASPDQIWQAIEDLLRQQGTDLSDYSLTGMEGQLSAQELAALLDSLRNGTADVSLSGLATTTTATAMDVPQVSSTTTRAPEKTSGPAAAAPEEPEYVPLGTEWSGFSPPLASKPEGRLVLEEKTWRKLWRSVDASRVPPVDFTQHAVVAVLAGKGERADRADIDSVEMSLNGLMVRYKFVTFATFNVDKPPRPTVPYRFRVIPRTTVPVQFELEKEESQPKPTSQEKK
jgi:hypothetical protein